MNFSTSIWSERRRAAAAAAVLLGVCAVGVGLPGGSAMGAVPSTFNASARADALDVEFTFPNAPVLPGGVAGGTSGSAQALTNSLGQSTAFASAPYPGDTLTTLPGTINGLINKSVFPSTYPAYASSASPSQPRSEVGINGYRLDATSQELTSRGAVVIGAESNGPGSPPACGTTLTATTAQGDDGAVTASSVADVVGVQIPGILSIPRVLTSASARQVAGQPASYTSTIDLANVTVAGVVTHIDAQGLKTAGTTVPLPLSEALQQALRSAGVTVHIAPEQRTKNGITSASLVITRTTEFPGQGTVTTVQRYGQTAASVTSAADEPSAVGPTAPGQAAPPGAPPAAAGPVRLSSAPAVVPAVPGATAGPSTVTLQPTAAPVELTAAAGGRPLSTGGFYLVLAGIGIAAVLGARGAGWLKWR